jgi:hypothetical protein
MSVSRTSWHKGVILGRNSVFGVCVFITAGPITKLFAGGRSMGSLKMTVWGPPEKGRPAGVRGGGWRPRPDVVVGHGAADLSVGSDSARAAVPGPLAGQPRFSRPDTRVQRAGAGGGGPRAMGATGDRPGVGTRRAARQAPGTAAGAARGATGSGNSDTDLTTSKNR